MARKLKNLTLADYLAERAHLEHNQVKDVDLQVEPDGLHVSYRLAGKDYKYLVGRLWSEVTIVYDSFVAASMLSSGYIPIALLDGGYLIVSAGGEEYQVEGMSCTCNEYLNRRPVVRCKHIILRDYMEKLQKRSLEYLLERDASGQSTVVNHRYHSR